MNQAVPLQPGDSRARSVGPNPQPAVDATPLVRPAAHLSPVARVEIFWSRVRSHRRLRTGAGVGGSGRELGAGELAPDHASGSGGQRRLGSGRLVVASLVGLVLGGAAGSGVVALRSQSSAAGPSRTASTDAPLSTLALQSGTSIASQTSPSAGGAGEPALGAGLGGSSSTTGTGVQRGTPATIAVHAAGAVRSPAVYNLVAGARVDDVVAAAGGLTPDADADAVNLAARVGDGERVFVPRKGQQIPAVVAGANQPEGAPLAGTPTAQAPIDLNTATAQQLDELPGVGPATAEKIVAHRTRIGRFRSINQLLDVPGIGEAKLAGLKPKVRI